NHAEQMSDLAAASRGIPSGVETIIMQHHGTNNGRGFVKTFSSNLSPLAIIFIVAERFSAIILDYKAKRKRIKDVAEILEILYKEFPKTNYHKAITALSSFRHIL
ncbi:MAG: hypothetical protein WCG27_10965, partial [Pseudomonadota bacterium]